MKIYRRCVIDIATWKIESEDSFEYEGPVADCKKNSNAPPPPDPNVVSAAQTRSNQDTAAFNAALNRGNTTTPLGSQTNTLRGYDERTGAPIYDETISLSPEQQGLLDQQTAQNRELGNVSQSMLGQIKNTYGKEMDTSGIPGLQTVDTNGLPNLYGADDLGGARQQIQDALYQKQASYLDPQWQQRDTAFRTRMANQGVVEGSEAWRNGLDDENRARSFDYDQARNSSITGGGDEMSRLAGIAQGNRGQTMAERLSSANSNNTAHAQAMEEALAKRNQPLNEFNALRNNSQVQMPQFGQETSGPGIAPTDAAQNIWSNYNGQLGIANANQAGRNGTTNAVLGGLASILPILLMASDKRVKENIKPAGELPQGLGVYNYNYKGDPAKERHTGVMAQEVEEQDPDAVITGPDGVKRVDYGRVLAEAMRRAH